MFFVDTWLIQSFAANEVASPNYNVYRRNWSNENQFIEGGVMIITQKNLYGNVTEPPESDVEQIYVSLQSAFYKTYVRRLIVLITYVNAVIILTCT